MTNQNLNARANRASSDQNRSHPAAAPHVLTPKVTPPVKCRINVKMMQNAALSVRQLHIRRSADLRPGHIRQVMGNAVEDSLGVGGNPEERAPKTGPWDKDEMNHPLEFSELHEIKFRIV
jgi:hypothetical protein